MNMTFRPPFFFIGDEIVTGMQALMHFQEWSLAVQQEDNKRAPHSAWMANQVFQAGTYGGDLAARAVVAEAGIGFWECDVIHIRRQARKAFDAACASNRPFNNISHQVAQ